MAHGQQEDPFTWEGSPPSPGASAAVEPSRRRGRRTGLASLAAVLVAAVVVATVLLLAGGGGSTALAQAASTTSNSAGFQYTLGIDVSAAGQSISASGSGSFSRQPLSGQMNLSFDGSEIRELLVPPYIYVQTPLAGSSWTRLAIPAGSPALSGSGTNPDPTSLIDMLRSVGSVSSVGTTVLAPGTPDAVTVTQYHAVLDVSRLAAIVPAAQRASFVAGAAQLGVTQLPVDAAVDAQGRLRQFTMSLSANTPAGAMSLSVSMTITNYGAQAPVTAPQSGVVDGGSAASPALTD